MANLPPPGPLYGIAHDHTVSNHDGTAIRRKNEARADARARTPGLDRLQQLRAWMAAGRQPPIGEKLGISLVEVDAGHAVFEGTPDGSVYNPIGSVHVLEQGKKNAGLRLQAAATTTHP